MVGWPFAASITVPTATKRIARSSPTVPDGMLSLSFTWYRTWITGRQVYLEFFISH